MAWTVSREPDAVLSALPNLTFGSPAALHSYVVGLGGRTPPRAATNLTTVDQHPENMPTAMPTAC